jgi:hypothetical protein
VILFVVAVVVPVEVVVVDVEQPVERRRGQVMEE